MVKAPKKSYQLQSSNPVFLLRNSEQKTISLQSVTIKVMDDKAKNNNAKELYQCEVTDDITRNTWYPERIRNMCFVCLV